MKIAYARGSSHQNVKQGIEEKLVFFTEKPLPGGTRSRGCILLYHFCLLQISFAADKRILLFIFF